MSILICPKHVTSFGRQCPNHDVNFRQLCPKHVALFGQTEWRRAQPVDLQQEASNPLLQKPDSIRTDYVRFSFTKIRLSNRFRDGAKQNDNG